MYSVHARIWSRNTIQDIIERNLSAFRIAAFAGLNGAGSKKSRDMAVEGICGFISKNARH